MGFQSFPIAAQTFFDPQRGLVCARVGICRHSFSVQHNPRIEMDRALGAKTQTFLADNRMSGIAAIEKSLDQLVDPLADAIRQHIADIDKHLAAKEKEVMQV